MLQPKKVLGKLPTKNKPMIPIRSIEEEDKKEAERKAYQYLRDSAKPGFKVDTGYTPNTTDHAIAQVQYEKTRGISTTDIDKVQLEDTRIDPNKNINTYSSRTKKVNAYKKGGEIKSNGTEVVKAMSGAQIMGAAAAPAAFIPVVGPILSLALGAGSAIWSASDAKKERRAKGQEIAKTAFDVSKDQQEVYGKSFMDSTKGNLPVYSKGGDMTETNNISPTGKLDAVGGDLIPISNNAEVVSGNTHKENKIDGSYGVTLSTNGKPIANVEDEEVIVDNNLVFSNKLKKGQYTFADIALGNNTRIGLLQDKLKNSKSKAEKFSLQRTIQGLEKANQDLFNEQEVVKSNTTGDQEETVKVTNGIVPKGAKGLSLRADAEDASGLYEESTGKKLLGQVSKMAPLLVDNLVNAVITSKAPAPNRPSYRQAAILDTNVNVNPQIASIAKAVNNSVTGIRSNTSNSAIARANMTDANLRGAELTGDVYAQKEQAERGIKNQQSQLNAANNNINAQLQDDYNEAVRQNKLDKQASISRNVGNVIEDFQAVKQTELDDKASQDIVNLSLLDDPTGEKMRRFRRLGKPLSKEDKKILLQEINRRK